MTRKAQVKRAKRIKMATRMRDFCLLWYWCTTNPLHMAAALAGARQYDARLRELEGDKA
jgi:hypothetical protein